MNDNFEFAGLLPPLEPRVGRFVRCGPSAGAGSQSTVWIAHDASFPVADAPGTANVPRRNWFVKLLAPRLLDDRPARDRFSTEALYTQAVCHENVVDFVEYGHEVLQPDGARLLYPGAERELPNGPVSVPYIVLEALEGWTFRRFFVGWHSEATNNPARFCARVLHLLEQACRGVEAVHVLGLAHRDIKPANLVVCRDWRGRADVVKVLDLGLAAPPGSEERTGPVLEGTLEYLAPEGFPPVPELGERYFCPLTGSTPHVPPRWTANWDERSDVYAMGCVALYALTGLPPFVVSPDDPDRLECLARAHRYAPPPVPRDRCPWVPSGFDAPIRRALAKNPDERFGTVAEFREALCAVPVPGSWTEHEARLWWSAQ